MHLVRRRYAQFARVQLRLNVLAQPATFDENTGSAEVVFALVAVVEELVRA